MYVCVDDRSLETQLTCTLLLSCKPKRALQRITCKYTHYFMVY